MDRRFVAAFPPFIRSCGTAFFVVILFSHPAESWAQQLPAFTSDRSNSQGLDDACQTTHPRALQLLAEFGRNLSAADRALAQEVVDKAIKNGQSAAEGYNAFAAGAFMQAQHAIAAWGALKATALEWNALFIANAGVYLFYLHRFDEADGFLRCAEAMNPQSPFITEAQAMLAYSRKDCTNATSLIERMLPLLPRDMNVRYTAGVIAYRCGNLAKAKQYLRAALDRRPNDKTVQQALKIVDPAFAPSVPPDDLHRLIKECLDFMDDTVAMSEELHRFYQRLDQIAGREEPLLDSEMENVRREVTRHKNAISARLAAFDRGHDNNAAEANALLRDCIKAYLVAIREYHSLWSISSEREPITVARSMGLTPFSLAERSKGNGYIILDEMKKYEEARKPIYETFESCNHDCPLSPREAVIACREACGEAYCGETLALWLGFTRAVQTNMNSADAGFPRAAGAEVSYWYAYALQAKDYSQRALRAMKFTAPSQAELELRWVRNSYQHDIGEEVMANLFAQLSVTERQLREALDDAPPQVEAIKSDVGSCQRRVPPPVSLAEAIDQLARAFNDATTYEAGFKPECELELGPFSVTVKPFQNDPNLEVSDEKGPWSWSGSSGPDRYAVEVTASKEIIGSGANPVKLNKAGIAAEVGATAWKKGEGGKSDFGVALYTKAGVGIARKDVGKVACYLFQGEASISARTLMSRLAN